MHLLQADTPAAAPARRGGRRQPVIAVATCAAIPYLTDEGRLLESALRRRGAAAVPVAWNSGADWSPFDAVFIGPTEDYYLAPEQFLDWTRSIGARLFNCPDVVAWNHDKRYLAELEQAGIPVVPTQYVSPGETYRLPAGRWVVKPAISAGSNSTACYQTGEEDKSAAHIDALHQAGRTVMLQPYCPRVDRDGETAVVFVDGEPTHCMRKEPLLRPGQPPADSRPEVMSPRTPDPDVLDLAVAAHAMVAEQFGTPLNARVDLVPGDDGRPLLLELELIELLLFLPHNPGAADLLASALLRRAGIPALTAAAPGGAS